MFRFSKTKSPNLANYRKWLRSVTLYTASITGKRKFEALLTDQLDSTPEKGSKARKLSDHSGLVFKQNKFAHSYQL